MAEALGTSSTGVTQKENGRAVHVEELGLTQIDGHPEDHPFIADVVFVHGLQGHPQRTWQSKSNTESSTRPQKRFRLFSWKATEVITQDDPKPFWPADILPQYHTDVRILTFGYDSKVTKGFMALTSKNGIFQHGNSFLRAVGRARIDCRHRPIVFVAHSLGGLVVKQALIEARKQIHEPDLLDIYNSTHAIIFFGTPHRGSNLASWGLLLSAIAEAVQLDTNNAVLRDLDPTSGSSKLEEMLLDFDDILQDSHRSREMRVYSFQEEKGMTSIKLFGGKVVPNDSSSLDSRKYGNDTIHANHMNMCRFDTKDDDGYKKFSGILAKYIGQIKTEQYEAEKARKDDILNRLDFAERRSREYQLQNIDANEVSFSWIWSSSSSFGDWLSSREGVYWISGKPGSGKSTLVDYLVKENRTKTKLQQHSHMDWIVLRFFFDFRGGEGVKNSFEGLLRSLLYQLIKEMPQLDALGLDVSEHDPFSGWPERRLRDALRTSLKNAKKGVCIFVDGLDEYEGDVLPLIEFLRSLATSNESQKTSIKICISSRPEAEPSQFLQHLPNLSMSDHNVSGIESYCLRTLEGLEPVVSEDLNISWLSHVIAIRAEGVFLWARFALEELIRGYCEAENIDELLGRLEKIPQSLEEVYDRILGRMEPPAKKECMIMLQLVCFSKRNLSWQELRVATDIAMDKDVDLSEPVYRDINSVDDASKMYKNFAKRLRAKSVGLLEIVEVNHNFRIDDTFISPKLMHKSVSTYLNQKGWQTLGGLAGDNSVEHESLYVDTCTRYLHRLLRHCKLEKNTSRSVWEDWFNEMEFYGSSSPKARQINHSTGIYPFFSYAACYIFEHAKTLERYGASSYRLLHESLTEQLVRLHHLCVLEEAPDQCWSCYDVPWELLFKDFDATCVAFLHGLVSYCKMDLATRSPTYGQSFWDRALRCALFSSKSQNDNHSCKAQEAISLALQNLTTVQQPHLEQALSGYGLWWPKHYRGVLKLVLQHESIKTLRLVDSNGQAVTLLWLFTRFGGWEFLSLLIEVANRRGEYVRQRCGPEGNMVETLLKQGPTPLRNEKLRLLRKYYESMSWPFEYETSGKEWEFYNENFRRDRLSAYDIDEIEREVYDEDSVVYYCNALEREIQKCDSLRVNLSDDDSDEMEREWSDQDFSDALSHISQTTEPDQ